MPTVITRTNYLEVNSVPLSTPAWWITNLETEIHTRRTYGDNLRINGAAGQRALIHRRDAVVMQFQLVVRGSVKSDGTSYSNVSDGLNTNLEYLIANLGLGSTSGDGTVTATYHRRDTTTKTAAVHVLSLIPGNINGRDAICVLELGVPAGQFA